MYTYARITSDHCLENASLRSFELRRHLAQAQKLYSYFFVKVCECVCLCVCKTLHQSLKT